ncbi:MAG: hypothetical protein HOV96_37090 [Nonomuraea sp.]|nr:hypothetical protein [Nonomuraea sp.]
MSTALTGGVVSVGAATATSANAATNVSSAATAATLAGCFRETRCGRGWGGRSWGHRWGGCHRRCGWGGWGGRGWGWRRHQGFPKVKVVIHNSNHNTNHS